MNASNKKLKISLCLGISVFLLYLVLDWVNLPSIIGIPINSINATYFGVLFNAFIVVVLYIISFFAIEKQQQKKDENAKAIAHALIDYTYTDCLMALEYYENDEEFKNSVVPKIQHGAIRDEQKEQEIFNQPFESFEQIMHFVEGGYISEQDLSNYFFVRRRFKLILSNKVTLMTATVNDCVAKKELEDDIALSHDLIDSLVQHINIAKKELGESA